MSVFEIFNIYPCITIKYVFMAIPTTRYGMKSLTDIILCPGARR